MRQESFVTRPSLDNWQTERLRLTGFPSPAPPIDTSGSSNWWRNVTGEEPERRISHPKRSGQQDEGPLRDGKLILRVEPARIDWFYTVDDSKFNGVNILSINS